MQATITYLLTEQAQRAQMVATGQPVARKQTMTIEVPAADLELFPVAEDGTITIDATGAYGDYAHALLAAGWAPSRMNASQACANQVEPPFLADLRRGRAILAEEQKLKEAEIHANGEHNRALVEEAYRAFLADPTARFADFGLKAPEIAGIRSPADYGPSDHEAFRAEVRRRNYADWLAKEAAERAKEQAKTAAIAAWVREHGTDSQRARLADGLLPRKEALAAMAEFAFAQAGVPEDWDYRVCDDRGHECGAVAKLASLDEAAYAAWAKIRATLPEGYTVTFWRVRECLLDGDDAETDEYRNPDDPTTAEPVAIASITIPFGPFAFERDVRLA